MSTSKYEKAWLGFSLAVVAAFLGVIAYFGFVAGFKTPEKAEVIDPTEISKNERFSNPGVEEVEPGELYHVYMVARQWSFSPAEIEVPKSATVKFYVTSPDVVHGFSIVGTNVQSMILPGYVTELTAKFEKEGEYLLICNEYCGRGHQYMQASVVVREGEE